MRLKLPEHFARWVMLSVAAFLVGFIIAQLLIPSAPGAPSSVKRLINGSQAQTTAEPILEKQEASFLPLVVALGVLVLLVTYGYYREKRRKE